MAVRRPSVARCRWRRLDDEPEAIEELGKTATLYDVARQAGVSTATVSRVIHGHDRVSGETRDRVRAVIEELGYVPDGAAQSLSRRRKEVIGLVGVERQVMQDDVENMSLLFYDEILHGVEARIRDHGWSLLITFLQNEEQRPDQRLLSLSGKVDGLLVGEGIVPSALLAQVAGRVPLCVVAGPPEERAVDVVTSDNRSGSAALVHHLLNEHGRRRLFHVDGPLTAPDARERRLALEEVVRSTPRVRLAGAYRGAFSVRSGVEAGEHLLREHAGELPDAVVCANDQMAIGVLQACARAGVRVPDDLAVVGFDDIYPGSFCDPALTTVHQPMRLLGERACSRLLERIANPAIPPTVEVLSTELVVRASCGCPPGTSKRLAVPALRRSRARRPIALRSEAGATAAANDGARTAKDGARGATAKDRARGATAKDRAASATGRGPVRARPVRGRPARPRAGQFPTGTKE